jgi:branched-chain amino acid transport system ATP-binding protein
MTILLATENLSVSYASTPVVIDVNLAVEDGSITVLLGANGAGKTTLLRAISNMMVQTTGEINLQGRQINRLATEAITRLGLAHVPDGRGTFVHLTVEDNLTLGAYTRRDRSGVKNDLERVLNYFPRLRERYRQSAGTLSGGEQQMLAISRALMLRPRLLLLDEPSFGLAPLVVREIFSILQAINRDDGVTILLVEQNADLALAAADYAYVLETGQIVMEGTGTKLASDESIRHVYLGY